MSFEHNPADEDREAYNNGLMVEEIKSLQATIAAQAAEIERLKAKHQREIDCVSSKWEYEWKRVVRKKDAELAAQAAEIERLKAENDLLHWAIKEAGDQGPELQRYRKLFQDMANHILKIPEDHSISIAFYNDQFEVSRSFGWNEDGEQYEVFEGPSIVQALEAAMRFGEPEKTC